MTFSKFYCINLGADLNQQCSQTKSYVEITAKEAFHGSIQSSLSEYYYLVKLPS